MAPMGELAGSVRARSAAHGTSATPDSEQCRSPLSSLAEFGWRAQQRDSIVAAAAQGVGCPLRWAGLAAGALTTANALTRKPQRADGAIISAALFAMLQRRALPLLVLLSLSVVGLSLLGAAAALRARNAAATARAPAQLRSSLDTLRTNHLVPQRRSMRAIVAGRHERAVGRQRRISESGVPACKQWPVRALKRRRKRQAGALSQDSEAMQAQLVELLAKFYAHTRSLQASESSIWRRLRLSAGQSAAEQGRQTTTVAPSGAEPSAGAQQHYNNNNNNHNNNTAKQHQDQAALRARIKMQLGADRDTLLEWLQNEQSKFNSLRNVTIKLIDKPPNKTINVCEDGPKILVMPNVSDFFYCYTREQWITKLWSDLRFSTFHYPFLLLNMLIFVSGTFGNMFVCLSVKRNHQLRNVTNYFIVNLAFADFLVILICLPATVVWDLSLTWFFDTISCKSIMFLQDVSVSVSVLTLTAISIDRYYAICHPFKFKSNLNQARRIIALIWAVSLLIMAPDLIYLSAKRSADLADAGLDTVLYSDCNYDWSDQASRSFQFVKTILLYFVPFLLMFCAHYRIMRELRLAARASSAPAPPTLAVGALRPSRPLLDRSQSNIELGPRQSQIQHAPLALCPGAAAVAAAVPTIPDERLTLCAGDAGERKSCNGNLDRLATQTTRKGCHRVRFEGYLSGNGLSSGNEEQSGGEVRSAHNHQHRSRNCIRFHELLRRAKSELCGTPVQAQLHSLHLAGDNNSSRKAHASKRQRPMISKLGSSSSALQTSSEEASDSHTTSAHLELPPSSKLVLTMHNQNQLESRRKAAKMLTAIVVLFGFCYLPVHLINFLRQFIDNIPQTDVTSTISMLAHCVCYLNSAINPIIYNHMNSVFRAEFRKFLSCFFDCCPKKRNEHEIRERQLSERLKFKQQLQLNQRRAH